MTKGTISGKEWLTLKEASEVSGRSLNSLRLLVHRKKIDKVKKIIDNGRSYWLIHRDTLDLPVRKDQSDEDFLLNGESSYDRVDTTVICHDDAIYQEDKCQYHDMPKGGNAQIPLEHYELQRSQWLAERDSLMQGLMMYRYKFEDLERQIKLLPAPPDIMSRELQWKDETLKEAQKIIQGKDEDLAEVKRVLREVQKNFDEERALRDRIEMKLKADLDRERNRCWWKKLLGLW